MTVFGGVLAVIAFFLYLAIQKSHYDQTGVWGPSRSQMRNIRRQARKKGISEGDQYEAWLARKQRGLANVPVAAPPLTPEEQRAEQGRRAFRKFRLIVMIVGGFAGVVWLLSLIPTSDDHALAVIDRERVNCRSRGTTDAAIVAQLSRGDTANIREDQGGWSRLREPDCWVRSDLLLRSAG